MGLGWLLGFVAAFTDWPALWYSFIVVNSLQGALLCIAFVATRQVSRLIVDCLTSLRRRVSSGTDVTSSSSEPPQSPMSPTIVQSNDTQAVSLSLA